MYTDFDVNIFLNQNNKIKKVEFILKLRWFMLGKSLRWLWMIRWIDSITNRRYIVTNIVILSPISGHRHYHLVINNTVVETETFLPSKAVIPMIPLTWKYCEGKWGHRRAIIGHSKHRVEHRVEPSDWWSNLIGREYLVVTLPL